MPPLSDQPQCLFRLAEVTPAELARIATAAAGSPVARPVAHPAPIACDQGSPVTAGLWRVEVTSDGKPACTLFVKLVRHTRLWPMLSHLPDEASRAEFVSYYPWHYELDIHQAGIESVLPEGMRMPVLRHVARPDGDHMGLWREFIRDRACYPRCARTRSGTTPFCRSQGTTPPTPADRCRPAEDPPPAILADEDAGERSPKSDRPRTNDTRHQEAAMKRFVRLSRSGWFLAGTLVTLVVVPAGAAAATVGVTELAGSNGQRAAVTRAGQLETAQAPPSSFVTRLGGADLTSASQSKCVTFPVISATDAVVIRQFTVTAYSVPGTLGSVLLYEGPNCQPSRVIDQLSYATPGITNLPVDPGIALPKAGTISVNVLGLGVLVAIFGYTAPAGDIAGYTSTGP